MPSNKTKIQLFTESDSETVLGVDTGGTFTDFVLYKDSQVRIHKLLSTPAAPEKAILDGMRDLNVDPTQPGVRVVHGTTVATNAALESKGVRTAFVTNKGFRDILSIGRQTRKELYNLTPLPSLPPVPGDLCLEVDTRRDSKGDLIKPLSDESIETLLADLESLKPQAVAICLLFSFLDDSEEQRIRRAIENRFGSKIFVTHSSWVLPEYKEYERGIATWYNAYLGPLVQSYLSRLSAGVQPAPLAIMQSSGTTIGADQAALRSVNLMLSGPAGGLAAVEYIGSLISEKKLLSFDMGGTSTDVALINERIKLTSEGKIGDYPVAVPMVDMHTIGAGGGSIACLDSGKMLHVGPESAGAKPGPACYGQGGISATVTDANAVLGRLQPDNFLGGRMQLNITAAERAVQRLADQMSVSIQEAAQGIIDLANEHMLQALRLISEQRGHDPSDYVLCGFGGAGGLHICALAESLGVKRAVVPAMGGVLSALGMLVAPSGRELVKAKLCLLSETDPKDLDLAFHSLELQAEQELCAEGHQLDQLKLRRSVDCRYRGQSYSLNFEWDTTPQLIKQFHHMHEQTYGHCFDLPIELVNLRVSANLSNKEIVLNNVAQTIGGSDIAKRTTWIRNNADEMQKTAVPMIRREDITQGTSFEGPMLVCEEASTTWVAPKWQVTSDNYGNLLLKKDTLA